MFGNTRLLNRLIVGEKDNPLKEPIGKHDVLHLLDVIRDEYWDEYARLSQHSSYNVFQMDRLGVFHSDHSKLKCYIWESINQLRRLRKRIKELQEEKRDFDPNNSMTVKIHDDLVLKLRASWKQLKNLQKSWVENAKYKL